MADNPNAHAPRRRNTLREQWKASAQNQPVIDSTAHLNRTGYREFKVETSGQISGSVLFMRMAVQAALANQFED